MPEGSTVQDAVEKSGLLTQFPEIGLSKQKIGSFGKLTRLDAILEEGTRVEIYRRITADPETVEQLMDLLRAGNELLSAFERRRRSGRLSPGTKRW